MRVLGIDPGLTRCGWGVVDGRPGQRPTAVGVGVVRSDADLAIELRLLELHTAVTALVREHQPDVVAIERVFHQNNKGTATGTAQAAGVAALAAAQASRPVAWHTPSEVKAAISGNGRADKEQVTIMVTRVLGLTEAPRPADAADALALAVCHVWRGPTQDRLRVAALASGAGVGQVVEKLSTAPRPAVRQSRWQGIGSGGVYR
ncbi:crossover junction endodeoxyribonuclease RuvC [Modestobacter sp. Leaf380]|uniref:crossover junction endodeoxyribonuclease RuvC n=1 Tax=Modestobacter sp. Leaf380 TaxID=1736356 RepID=UPI0006F50991|nr:crossover junction endodeoxyribonuclease RuvC [Modestobacter sp. Leaf380]KQS64928.1 Holliday junction resolvase [Modestobacter sp. Leaf380]